MDRGRSDVKEGAHCGAFSSVPGNRIRRRCVQPGMTQPIPAYEPPPTTNREPDEQATEAWREWLSERTTTPSVDGAEGGCRDK